MPQPGPEADAAREFTVPRPRAAAGGRGQYGGLAVSLCQAVSMAVTAQRWRGGGHMDSDTVGIRDSSQARQRDNGVPERRGETRRWRVVTPSLR